MLFLTADICSCAAVYSPVLAGPCMCAGGRRVRECPLCTPQQEAVKNCQYWRLRDPNNKPPGVIGYWPTRAVTFIDNHDTGTLDYPCAFVLPYRALRLYIPLLYRMVCRCWGVSAGHSWQCPARSWKGALKINKQCLKLHLSCL